MNYFYVINHNYYKYFFLTTMTNPNIVCHCYKKIDENSFVNLFINISISHKIEIYVEDLNKVYHNLEELEKGLLIYKLAGII